MNQTVEEAMTPIESAFSVDINSKLDWYVLFFTAKYSRENGFVDVCAVAGVAQAQRCSMQRKKRALIKGPQECAHRYAGT
jgi:hypothetical protein